MPTVSAKVEEEEKKKKKKSVKNTSSKDSNDPTKKKKAKKKTSKESIPEDPIETKGSAVNLLAALENPSLNAGYLSDDDNTTINEDHPEKAKPKAKKKKASSPKTSEADLLTHSHSSLRDYFPDPALKHYLQGLHVSYNFEAYEMIFLRIF